MTTFDKTHGKFATDRYTFQDHVDGKSSQHVAGSIALSPTLDIGFNSVSTVEAALNDLNNSYVLTVGDGYDCYPQSAGGYYDSTVPAIDGYLTSLIASNVRLHDGGIIFIKAGTYKISDKISIPPGITLMGEGFGTKLINTTSNKSMFLLTADPYRVADVSIDPDYQFMHAKRTCIKNITISDNFMSATAYGNSSYLNPTTTSDVGLFSIDADGAYEFDGVYFLGRHHAGSLTAKAIGINTLAVNGGTDLTIKNCFFDGFGQILDFRTLGSANDLVITRDYLKFESNKCRAFGGVTYTSFIKTNACNASIQNNYFYNGLYKTGLGVTSLPIISFIDVQYLPSNSISRNQRPIFSTKNNYGTSDKTNKENPGNRKLVTIPTSLLSKNVIFDISNNGISSDYAQSLTDHNKFYVTVGDGYNSIGDFNGSGALNTAVQVIGLQNSGKIFLKPGNHVVTSQLAFSSGDSQYSLEIEGTSSDSANCQISLVGGYGDSTLFYLLGSRLHVKNIFINSIGVKLFNASNSYVKFEDCILSYSGAGLIYSSELSPNLPSNSSNYIQNNNYLFKSCKINTATETGVVDIYCDQLGYASQFDRVGKIIIDNCDVNITSSLVTFYKTNLTSGPSLTKYFDGLLIKDCRILISEVATPVTTTGGFKYYTSAFGLIYLNDSGTNKTGNYLNPKLIINKIKLKDCFIDTIQSVSTAKDVPIFQVCPAISNYKADGGFIRVQNFEIHGCEFNLSREKRTLSPFNIVLDQFETNTRISIKDTSITNSTQDANATNGGQPGNFRYWFDGYQNDGYWACCNLHADIVELENLKLSGFERLTNSGELNVYSKQISAKNITINNYLNVFTESSTDNAPNYRCQFNGGGTIDGLTLQGFDKTSAKDWITDQYTTPANTITSVIDKGILILGSDTYHHEPGNDGYISHPLKLVNSKISNFNYSGNEVTCAICIKREQHVQLIDLKIDSCQINDCMFAIASSESVGGSLAIPGGNITISNSTMSSAGLIGAASLYFYYKQSTTGFGTIRIHNNNIQTIEEGFCLYFGAYAWGAANAGLFFGNDPKIIITNNSMFSGNPDGFVATIEHLTPEIPNQGKMNGAIYGNSFGSNSAGSNIMQVFAQDGFADGYYDQSSIPMLGIETGYPGIDNTAKKAYKNNTFMIHNNMILKIRAV